MKAKKKKVTVTVVSHDSWSGPEVLYTKSFTYRKNAEKFCDKFNSKNTATVVPEYYEIARID